MLDPTKRFFLKTFCQKEFQDRSILVFASLPNLLYCYLLAWRNQRPFLSEKFRQISGSKKTFRGQWLQSGAFVSRSLFASFRANVVPYFERTRRAHVMVSGLGTELFRSSPSLNLQQTHATGSVYIRINKNRLRTSPDCPLLNGANRVASNDSESKSFDFEDLQQIAYWSQSVPYSTSDNVWSKPDYQEWLNFRKTLSCLLIYIIV